MLASLSHQSVAEIIMLASQIQLSPQGHSEGACQDTGIIYGSHTSSIPGFV